MKGRGGGEGGWLLVRCLEGTGGVRGTAADIGSGSEGEHIFIFILFLNGTR